MTDREFKKSIILYYKDYNEAIMSIQNQIKLFHSHYNPDEKIYLDNPMLYLIPVYNSVQCMSSIFALQFNAINFVITIISNIVYIGAGVYLLAKMFNSEKIMSSN